MIPPLKLGDPVTRNWRTINQISASLDRSQVENQGRDAAIAGLRQRALDVGAGMFPFRIYRSPADPAGDPTEAWRTFRVRGGNVWIQGYGDDPVEKTDAAENPDVDPVPDFDGVNIDFVVPDLTGQYWVWIEITGNGPYVRTIKHGAEPTANGYDSYPALDDRHIMVGYIDTDTHSADSIAVVRQLERADMTLCPPADV